MLPWWKHRDEAHVLFLKYEDLKKVNNFHVLIISVLVELQDIFNSPTIVRRIRVGYQEGSGDCATINPSK